ncbi:hypothetical protein XF_0271 [Xylella fastidiosa 9a5c]|uniref:Uncharacterized protein n=1 Tax=Xylella fastidiosa (strain 9a5c) TaxID=160492 RepID=Q9PGM7_XYLFA|nr:hypothetical protein XF_0271 [Xylella fastidiosa 9a5c]
MNYFVIQNGRFIERYRCEVFSMSLALLFSLF